MDFEAALLRYGRNLEDLTFNSKPLIDDLTRAAGQLEPKGDKVVGMIQKRIMKVARRWNFHHFRASLVLFCFFICTNYYTFTDKNFNDQDEECIMKLYNFALY